MGEIDHRYKELVPGDIVVLSQGSIADGVLMQQ